MEQKLTANITEETESRFQFMHEGAKEYDNPFIRITVPDKSIPFVVLPDGGVAADITANNPKTILTNLQISNNGGKTIGAGIIDVYYGNRTLVFRHVESQIFERKWLINDVASALQSELNLYYPDYRIRSH